jgi:HK97 family phage major capsid protein
VSADRPLPAILADAHALAAEMERPDYTLTDADRERSEALISEAKAAAALAQRDQADRQIKDWLDSLFMWSPEQVERAALELPGAPPAKSGFAPPARWLDHPWVKAVMPSAPDGGAKAALPVGTALAVPVSPGVFGLGQIPTPVASICTSVSWASGSAMPYFRQTTRTSNAAVVAHGAQKPTSVYSLTRLEAKVATIAHLSEAQPRQDLADLAGLSNWLRDEMLLGLARALDNEILGGVGTSADVEGILDATGTLAQDYSVSPIETLRLGLGLVEAGGFGATAVVLHPSDSQAIDLAKDTQERYYGAGPFGAGPATIWGIPRISSPEMPVGTAIVGDFRRVTVGWREQATLLMSDSGPGLFDMNMVQGRAELRAAIAVTTPPAFAVCDLTAA